MKAAWVRAIVILPGNVLIVIPAIVLCFTGWRWPGMDGVWRWLGLAAGGVLFALGFSLAVWTMRLFATRGKGTAAPWNPPKHLVVAGPYTHVRNPMISSVLMMLAGEALVLGSWPLAALLGVFFLMNALYFPLFEEKDLAKRFGEDYMLYKKNVPRWLPRLSAWTPPERRDDE